MSGERGFGRDEGCTDELVEISGATMALGDGRVELPQEGADGGADDITATEDDGVSTGDGDTSGLDETNDACGGAGSEKRGRSTRREIADVVRVESGKTDG